MIKVERLQNLDETPHNERKEAHADQHKEHRHHFLNIGLRYKITITDRRQARDTEVDHSYEIVELHIVIYAPLGRYRLIVSQLSDVVWIELLVEVQRRHEVISAAGEVCYYNGQEHQSDHCETLHDEVPVLDRLLPWKLANCQINDYVESLLVDQIEYLGDSDHPNHLEANTINVVEHVKRESRQQIQQEPARLQVLLGNVEVTPHLQLLLGVALRGGDTQKVEDDVEGVTAEDHMFQLEEGRHAIRKRERYIVR